MSKLPVVTIQCDWNDVIRLPNSEAWISYKYFNENSVHDKIKTAINKADGKIKIIAPSNFQYVSHSNLCLVFNHIQSSLRVAFVAPTKVHSVHDKAVVSVSASDKAITISSCESDKVLIWDNRTGEVSLDLKGHCGPVYKCRFFPSGTVVFTAGADGSCKIWSAESGINPVTLRGHTMAVTDICIVDKGRNVISVSKLPNSEAWISYKYFNENSVHDKIKTAINKADGKIKIIAPSNFQYVSHSNLCLVFNHIQSSLRVAFVAPTKVHSVHDKAVVSVSASDKAITISSCESDKVLIWDNRTGEVSLDLKGHCGPVYKCRFFPSGTVVFTAGADGSCKIWSAESGINPVTLRGHTMAVTDICIVDKGRNVISVSKDGSAKLWDVGQSNCLGNILEGHGIINCCALAIANNETVVSNEREIGTGNKILVSGCESGLVICAHVAKREEIFCKQMDSACNACITIEQSIIVGCNNGKIIQMNVQDGSIIREWHESASPVQSLEALPNNLFIVGRQDGTCTVQSLKETHANIRVQLTGSDCDGIRDIAFNGKWIFAACRDTHIRKYDYNQVTVHFKTVSKQDS